MFLVNHTASVPGRIRLLIVSMTNMNGINIVGVSCGARRSNIWLVFLTHPNSINHIHIGRARVNAFLYLGCSEQYVLSFGSLFLFRQLGSNSGGFESPLYALCLASFDRYGELFFSLFRCRMIFLYVSGFWVLILIVSLLSILH
jgi:hypothetical protein